MTALMRKINRGVNLTNLLVFFATSLLVIRQVENKIVSNKNGVLLLNKSTIYEAIEKNPPLLIMFCKFGLDFALIKIELLGSILSSLFEPFF